MRRAKIAPTVRLAVEASKYPFPGCVNGERAEREFRALLAVADALEDLVAAADTDGMLCVNLIEFARRLRLGREAIRAARGETA